MRFVPICSPFLDAIAAFASSIEAKRTKPYLPPERGSAPMRANRDVKRKKRVRGCV